jgi:hypothetical protein
MYLYLWKYLHFSLYDKDHFELRLDAVRWNAACLPQLADGVFCQTPVVSADTDPALNKWNLVVYTTYGANARQAFDEMRHRQLANHVCWTWTSCQIEVFSKFTLTSHRIHSSPLYLFRHCVQSGVINVLRDFWFHLQDLVIIEQRNGPTANQHEGCNGVELRHLNHRLYSCC